MHIISKIEDNYSSFFNAVQLREEKGWDASAMKRIDKFIRRHTREGPGASKIDDDSEMSQEDEVRG